MCISIMAVVMSATAPPPPTILLDDFHDAVLQHERDIQRHRRRPDEWVERHDFIQPERRPRERGQCLGRSGFGQHRLCLRLPSGRIRVFLLWRRLCRLASDEKSEPMIRRFILYRRKLGGTFYVEDTETRKQESLGTKDRAEATSLVNARNESVRQPQLNLQIAKAYLAGTDSGVSNRTWQQALDAIVETKSGSTQDRWRGRRKRRRWTSFAIA